MEPLNFLYVNGPTKVSRCCLTNQKADFWKALELLNTRYTIYILLDHLGKNLTGVVFTSFYLKGKKPHKSITN